MTFNFLMRSTNVGAEHVLPVWFLPRLRGRIKEGVLSPSRLPSATICTQPSHLNQHYYFLGLFSVNPTNPSPTISQLT